MGREHEQDTDTLKFDQIIKRLDRIENSIFTVLEDKLTKFRGELSKTVDDNFRSLKEYLDTKVSNVRTDLEDTLDDHESRIVILEKETGLRALDDSSPLGDPSSLDKAIKRKKRRLVAYAVIIGFGITALNTAVLMLLLLYFRH